MSGKALDTMTVIKSICSGVGALSAVLLCASVLWSEMGNLDDEKLDKEVFVQYREDTDRKIERLAESNSEEHSKIADSIEEMKIGIGEINTNMRILMEERNR